MPDGSEDPIELDAELESFLGDIPLRDPEPTVSPIFADATFEDIPDEPPVQDTPSFFDGATATIGDGTCVVCGAPTFRPPGLTKAGRKKRTPKYCDLHTPNPRVSYEGPDAAGMESQLRRIQEELADDIRLLGTLTGPMFPVTGYYLIDNADPFTVAVLKLAKNNTRFLRVLHRAASVAPVYTIAKTGAGVALAVQVDQHKVDPHSSMAQRLGVSNAYDTIYFEQSPSNTSNVTSNGNGVYPNQPPRYASSQ